MHFMWPPTRLAALLRAKGLPDMLAYVFETANGLNAYVATHDSRGAVGSLFFLCATNCMWIFLHTMSRLTANQDYKVRFTNSSIFYSVFKV